MSINVSHADPNLLTPVSPDQGQGSSWDLERSFIVRTCILADFLLAEVSHDEADFASS